MYFKSKNIRRYATCSGKVTSLTDTVKLAWPAGLKKTVYPNTFAMTSFICFKNVFTGCAGKFESTHYDHCDSCLITNTKELWKTRSARENLIRLPTSSNVSNCHTYYVITAYDRSREKLFKLHTWENCRFYGFISKFHRFNLVLHSKRTKMTNANEKRFRIHYSYLVQDTKSQSCEHAASKDCPQWIMKIKQKRENNLWKSNNEWKSVSGGVEEEEFTE